jgi:hypothetical protein
MGLGVIVLGLSTWLLRACRIASSWRGTWIVDGMRDPTSHNVWPLGVVIALLVGFACAVLGSTIGSAMGALSSWRAGPSGS